MYRSKTEEEWNDLAQEVITGMAEWRQQHLKATFREIQEALDQGLDRLRSRMLSDVARMSPRADWREEAAEDRPKCPDCQTPLESRSLQRRSMQSQGIAEIVLDRSQGTCPECGTSLFPPG